MKDRMHEGAAAFSRLRGSSWGECWSPFPGQVSCRWIGQGKRGGARTIVATKMAGRWFFLYGFIKNDRYNIDKDELRVLQEMAMELPGFDDRQLAIVLAAGEIAEICNDDDKA